MNVSELVNYLQNHKYALMYGAPKIAKRTHSIISDVKEAKKIYYSSTRSKNGDKNNHFLKILIFDIETSPMKAYVWKRWKENISLDQTISEWFCIAWSAKWLYSDEVMGDVLTPNEVLNEDDSRSMKKLYDLVCQADVLVAHNGDKFDIPKINSRFIYNGFQPYKPVFSIDTCKICKKQFGFSSNKLDALAGYFGIPHKLETNFELWKKCMEGDAESLNYMLQYNKMDVKILEEVYLRLRPWIKSGPNMAMFSNNDISCCQCASNNLELLPGEYYYTSVNMYQLYRCKDCGAITRGRLPLKLKKPVTTKVFH